MAGNVEVGIGDKGILYILIFLAVLGAVIYLLVRSPAKAISDAISSVTKPVSDAISQTVAQITNKQNTISALAGDTTVQKYENSVMQTGNQQTAILYPGYETPNSVQTRLDALPSYQAALVNTGDAITGGLASALSAALVGKTTNPSTKFKIGDNIIWMSPYGNAYWRVEDITPTQYVLSSMGDHSTSYNPLISDVDNPGMNQGVLI